MERDKETEIAIAKAKDSEINKPHRPRIIPEANYLLSDSSQTKLDVTLYRPQDSSNNKMNNFLKALSVIRNKGEAENNNNNCKIHANSTLTIPQEMNNFKITSKDIAHMKRENFITSIKAVQIGNSNLNANLLNKHLLGEDFSRNYYKNSAMNKQHGNFANSFSPPQTLTANTTTEYDRNISENSYNNANLTLEENVINYINNPVEKNIQLKNNEIRVNTKINHHSGRVANTPYKMEVNLGRIPNATYKMEGILKPLLKEPIKIIEDEEGEKEEEIREEVNKGLMENIHKLDLLKIDAETKNVKADSQAVMTSNNLNSYRTNINDATTKVNTVVNSKNKSTHYTNESNAYSNTYTTTVFNMPFAAGDNIFLESPENRRNNKGVTGANTSVPREAREGSNLRKDTHDNNAQVAPFSITNKVNPKIPKAKIKSAAVCQGNIIDSNTLPNFSIQNNPNHPNHPNHPNQHPGLDVNSTPSLSSNLDDLDEVREINLNEYHFDGTGGPSISPYNYANLNNANPNNPNFKKKLNISDLDIFNLHLDFDISNENIMNSANKNSKILIVDSMLNSSNSPIINHNKQISNMSRKNNTIVDNVLKNIAKPNKPEIEPEDNRKRKEDSFLRKKQNPSRVKNTRTSQENNLSDNLSQVENYNLKNTNALFNTFSNTNTLNTNSTTKKIRRKYFKSEIFEGKNNSAENIADNSYGKLEEDELNEGLSAIEAFGDLGNLDEDYEINQFVIKNQKSNNVNGESRNNFAKNTNNFNINNLSSSRSLSNLSQRKVSKNLLKKFNSANPNDAKTIPNACASKSNNSNNANYFSRTNLFDNNINNLNGKCNGKINGKTNGNYEKNSQNLKENILQIQVDTERTNQSEKALELEEEYEIEEIDLRTDYENTNTLTLTRESREENTNKGVAANMATNRTANLNYLQATEKKNTNHKKNAFRSFVLTTENSASGTSNYILNKARDNNNTLEGNKKVNSVALNPKEQKINPTGNRPENIFPNTTPIQNSNNNAHTPSDISPYTNYNLVANYNAHLPMNITASLNTGGTLNNSNPVNTLNTINSVSMKSNFSNTASSSLPNSNSNSNYVSNTLQNANNNAANSSYPYKTPDNKIRKHNTLNDISILGKFKNLQKSEKNKKNKKNSNNEKNEKICKSQSFISQEYEQDQEQDSFIDTVFDLDFINNLLAKENYYKADPNYLSKHPRLELSYRCILIEWLMELCEEYAFKRDTFHYAVNYVDRFMSKLRDVSKMSLQLIGVVSLSLAAKFEEVQIPKIQDYLNATDNSYSQDEFIATERLILKTLRWEIIPTTINTWLNWYVCQWDLYLDSFPENLLQFEKNESNPIYFKKADEGSYIHYRMVTQLIDLYIVDYYSLKFSSRKLIAASMLILLSKLTEVSYFTKENQSLYDFDEKFFKSYLIREESRAENNFEKNNFIVEIFSDFMHQGFNISTQDEEFLKCLVYCAKYQGFDFNFDLPLVLQGNEDKGLENVIF